MEISRFLEQQVGLAWVKLPAKVVDTLIKAEAYYRSEVNDDDAKVWFHKAVEASLDHCLVRPLINFRQRGGHKHIAVCLPSPRGLEQKKSTELERLSLLEWGGILEMLTISSHKGLASLGIEQLKEFMKTHLGGLHLPDFRLLSESLRAV